MSTCLSAASNDVPAAFDYYWSGGDEKFVRADNVIRVVVIGQVDLPGICYFKGSVNLRDVVSIAKPNRLTSLPHVAVIRGNGVEKKSIWLDLSHPPKEGEKQTMAEEGDIVAVETKIM